MLNLVSLIPIIVAVIGIIGTIIPALIENKLLQSEKEPLIMINNDKNFSENSVMIDLHNTGKIPATNISLFIETFPFTILNLTNVFSTSNIFVGLNQLENNDIILVNKSYIQLQIPKLIQGPGSIISLKIFTNQNIEYSNLAMMLRIIYDQGSSSMGLGLLPVSQQKTYPELLSKFVQEFSAIYSIFYIFLIGFLVYYFGIKLKKRYLKKIIEGTIEIRRILNLDIHSSLIFKKFPKRNNKFMKTVDIKDYILLDDFFTILEQHNILLQSARTPNKSEIGNYELIKLNNKLLKIANKILNEINWKQYI